MTLTYPKAGQLSVGYDPKEDRLFLVFHLQDDGFRKSFVSRRILGALLGHMSEQLAVLSTVLAYIRNIYVLRSSFHSHDLIYKQLL